MGTQHARCPAEQIADTPPCAPRAHTLNPKATSPRRKTQDEG
eukprot:CAMPEP_0182929990 /NCGR_PEP_ID=MMETSP0105_2-20130417/23411_1 /TAXON_ID=81532 ORGANISM="Acanthoeca-like sp., Strain 10tr" /NCGR_SAMPLE_ID=MMETSP0105_2 /ASSEMBLY_ACC=CAM_ASM_000205 /LENGTH=41 /DNA_ID= /DNA_START= /DNA_END= /DNA_ORIENTATION=